MPDVARKDQTKVYLAYGISAQGTYARHRTWCGREADTEARPSSCWPWSRCETALRCTREEGKRGC